MHTATRLPTHASLQGLAIAAACVAVRWLIHPLMGHELATLPAAVAVVMVARWGGFGPACIALAASLMVSEALFAEPAADVPGMLWRDRLPLVASVVAGIVVARSVSILRERAVLLEQEVAGRRRAEAELDDSRRRFAQFMDSSPFCAYVKDSAGRFAFVNRHLREVYPDVEVGRTVDTAFPEQQVREFTRNDDLVRSGGAPVHCEEVATGPDGTVKHWSTFKFPVLDADGCVCVGGIAVDVTEAQQMRQRLSSRESLLRRLIDVQESEKQALCHEFHDGLIQYAIGAKMSLEAFLRDHPGVAAAAIEDAINCLAAGIADGRRTIRGIRPAVLDDLGLKAAVEEVATTLAGSEADIDVAIGDGVDGVSSGLQTTAFRIVQEAVANARRHSGAQRVAIDLRIDGGELVLRVEDSGRGFDLASASGQGFGLLGMTERALLAGGRCTVDSRPGAGTAVVARLPVSVRGEQDGAERQPLPHAHLPRGHLTAVP
jgi:PAS domain S-box-containing protein